MRRQNGKKVNRMFRMAMVLLYLVIVSTWITTGLYAKYTSQAEGSDRARVAAWNVDAEGSNPSLKIDCSQNESSDENGYQIKVTNESEVSMKYDVIVVFSEVLPNGVTATLDASTTTNVSADKKTYIFEDAGTLSVGISSKTHELNLNVDKTKVNEDFARNFSVKVEMMQVD